MSMAALPLAPQLHTAPAPSWGNLAAHAPVLRVAAATDADEHAHNLTGWQQRYDQLSSGRFVGDITELHLPQMQVFRERTSQALRQSCQVWPDAIWFGVPDEPVMPDTGHGEQGATRINGRLHGAHDIMIRPGHEAFELVTPEHHSLFGVVVRQDVLMEASCREGWHIDWQALQHAEVLHVDDSASIHTRQVLSALLSLPGQVSPQADALHPSGLQAELVSVILRMLDTSEVDQSARQSQAKRQGVVARAQAHLLAHPDKAVTVPELCEQLHVSRRTLQYCFEDVLGMSPMQCLKAMRLNGARRQLRDGARSGLSVQDVAAHWGFWHLSQFACDYRKLFEETPSETLRQGAH
jgi:AraC family ethanolamine operon transcriptional activator